MLAGSTSSVSAGGARHQVEPIGVLGGRAVVRPLELGDVQAVLVAVDDQRHLGDVALVEPIAGDALPRRPAAQVLGPLRQPRAEQLGLLVGLLRQAAEGRAPPERRASWRGSFARGQATRLRPACCGSPLVASRFQRSHGSESRNGVIRIALGSSAAGTLAPSDRRTASGRRTGSRCIGSGRCRACGAGRPSGRRVPRNRGTAVRM